MPHKHFSSTALEIVELKAGADDSVGEFTAYASTFGNRDHGGDIIQKGAFTETLKDRGFRPLLWQHDMREPIGIEKSLKEDGKGLVGTWQLVDTQRGRDAYKLLQAGAVRSMSIGYIPTKWEFIDEDNDMTRLIKGVDLLENSVVSLPMNEMAKITGVKGCVMCGDSGNHAAALDLDVPLDDLLAQVRGYVIVGSDEAEALHQRRSTEQRKLSEGHIEALRRYSEELKNSVGRIEAILTASTAEPDTGDGESPSTGGALNLRLEITKRRMRVAGFEV